MIGDPYAPYLIAAAPPQSAVNNVSKVLYLATAARSQPDSVKWGRVTGGPY